jgi:hypothetical protein
VSESADDERDEPEPEETAAEPEPSEPVEPSGPAEPAEPAGPSVADLAEAFRRIEVGEFLLSTVSTLASLAFAKLEQAELGQAKLAIDAIGAILPALEGQVDEGLLRDFHRALANLQVAYADAASGARESTPPE